MEWQDLATIRAPASQNSSHVGKAGVGVIRMRGAPVALLTFATVQFRRFFDCGRAIRCLLPLGSGRFMHLVVLFGYQGADSDAEQLALTEQLFDAVLGDSVGVVSRAEPCQFDCWGLQRGANQNPLPSKRDFGWALRLTLKLVPSAPFLQCEPHLTAGGFGVLADPASTDEEFRKAWLPYFCGSGQRALRSSLLK